MREIIFKLGVFLLCVWKFYYNFVDVVPTWLNDSYFVVESLLLALFICSSNWSREFRLIGGFGAGGSFLYFLLRYLDIFKYQPIGAKYFVPSIITIGILIVGYKAWQRYH